jgi:hypothetical protein
VDTWQILLVVGVVVVGGIAMLNRRAHRMRKGNLDAQLAQHGWSRVAEDSTLCDRWHGPPFGQGTDRRATNVISGGYRGRAVLAFDYAFSGRFQEGTVRETYAVYAVDLPARLPDLALAPEGIRGRMRTAMGRGDVRVGDDAFDRTFRIDCADPNHAAAILHPEVRRKVLEAGKRSYRFENGALLTWELGSIDAYALDPKRLERQFDLLVSLVDAVPDQVWRGYGGRAQT